MTDATHGDTPAGTDQGQDWTIALDSVLDHVYNALALGQTEDEADGTDVVATAWLHQLDEILLLDEPNYQYLHAAPAPKETIRPADLVLMRTQALELLPA